jgi:hypothetical protein
MAANRMPVDPDTGIPDLIRRLGDDSKRLMADEVQLAKLEIKDNLKRGGKGVMWLGIAFGIGAVAMVFFTLTLATLIGRIANGHMWLGAIVTGIVEVALAVVLIKKGLAAFSAPSYTLQQTRESLKDTQTWVKAST